MHITHYIFHSDVVPPYNKSKTEVEKFWSQKKTDVLECLCQKMRTSWLKNADFQMIIDDLRMTPLGAPTSVPTFLCHPLRYNIKGKIPLNLLHPYRQIPETISKKRARIQGISRKLFPDFSQVLQFWGVTQDFPETISNIWKKFPEILLGHYPNLRNFKFHLKS